MEGDSQDSSTVQFIILLLQAFAERKKKEEEEEEDKGQEVLEEKLATREHVLHEEVESRLGSSDFSPLEYAAIRWAVYKQLVVHRERLKGGRRRGGREG